MPKRKRPERSDFPIHTVDMASFATLPGFGREVYEVAAIMFHPRDAAARRSFVTSAVVDMMERIADLTSPRGEVKIANRSREVEILNVDRLLGEAMAPKLNRKGAKGQNNERDPYSGVNIAAKILARAFALADEGWPETGIIQVLEDQGKAYKSDGVVGAGRDRLTEIWQEYRASAHIALSYSELDCRLLEDRRGFFEWVGRSMDYLKRGSLIGSRFAAPILPPEECWSIVLFPTAGG